MEAQNVFEFGIFFGAGALLGAMGVWCVVCLIGRAAKWAIDRAYHAASNGIMDAFSHWGIRDKKGTGDE